MFKSILLLSLSILFLSQEVKAINIQEPIYSAAELQEDFDYYIQKLKEFHPDLYTYCSQIEFEERVESIKKQINKPMRVSEFGIIVMNLNSYLDGHTGISFGAIWENFTEKKRKEIETYKNNNGKFLPYMQVKGDRLFFKGEEVLSINQLETKKFMSKFCLKITDHDTKKRSDYIKSHYLCTEKYSFIFYNLTSPFKMKTQSATGEIRTFTEEGWSSDDYNEFLTKDSKPWKPIDCTMYTNDSIACIDFNTCYIEDYDNGGGYKQMIDSVFRQVNSTQVKYLFINVTRNEGGSYPVSNYMFNKINRDALYWNYTTIMRTGKTNETIYGEHYYDEIKSGFNGNVFIMQSPWTFSSADDFCRLGRLNKCVLVGEPTGHTNIVITESRDREMPNTKLTFSCSNKKYIYSDCDEDGLCPDIPFEMSIYKYNFSLTELKKILDIWKTK